MDRLETVSTASVPASNKVRFWNEAVSSAVAAAAADPLLALCVPREGLTRYFACPEAACSVVVSSSTSGAGARVAGYLRDFWSHAQHDLSPPLVPRFAQIASQMVAGAYAGIPGARPDRSCRLTEHRMRIRSYIEEHLYDTDLAPKSSAAALRITRGYLHRLFPDGHESVARYISRRRIESRRRLEECHRDLSDCMQSGRSVTHIAFEHGFNSLPHFSRVFRSRFGITPSELRRRAGQGGSGLAPRLS